MTSGLVTTGGEWRLDLRENGKRILVDFPYSQDHKDLLQARVQGLKWDAKARLWHFPLDLDSCREVLSVVREFNGQLKIEPDLKQWIKEEKERFSNLLRPDDMSVDSSRFLPAIRKTRGGLVRAMSSKPWQIPGAAFIADQKKVLLADQPGLGKTIQTLAAIAELDLKGPILVVAPRTAVNVTWPEEIAQWLGSNEAIVSINSTLKPAERSKLLTGVYQLLDSKLADRVWVLCGPNYLRIRPDLDGNGNYQKDATGKNVIRTVNEGVAELFDPEWAAIIVDESHQTLAGATGNKKKQSAQRLGLGALKIAPGGLRVAISGTPFRGKTENLWGTLNWLYPEKYSSYWAWIRKHYGISNNGSRFGSGIAKGDKILDQKRFFQELAPIMVRRTKREVAKSLPPKTYGGTRLDPDDGDSPIAVWLPMSKEQKRQYDEIVQHAMITIDEMGDQININGALAEMIRMKQVANSCLSSSLRGNVIPAMPSNKVEWIEDFLKERIDAGTKVIIASQFSSFLYGLSDHLHSVKIGHYVLTGKTNDTERASIKKMFQKPEGEMVILLNTKSGGVSLTLDAADDVVICDQTWVPDDQEQVEDRAHRVSRDHNVTIWNLASLETIDEDIAKINQEREGEIINILDRQRGVFYVKQLIAATKKRQEKEEKGKKKK